MSLITVECSAPRTLAAWLGQLGEGGRVVWSGEAGAALTAASQAAPAPKSARCQKRVTDHEMAATFSVGFFLRWRPMNEYKPTGGDILLVLVFLLLCVLIAALSGRCG